MLSFCTSEIQVAFYTNSTPQFGGLMFQVHSGHLWLVATTLDSVGLEHFRHRERCCWTQPAKSLAGSE